MQITHHTQLLQALIDKYNLKSYLELGVQNTANNFDQIRIAFKEGVDPEVSGNKHIEQCTSDEFFERMVPDANRYDLIFIDGDHTKEQVKKDFDNSLRCLADHGFIVIHDVLPENEEGTKVPRETKQWWGDVYKWAMNIGQYAGISFRTLNIDNGCMLVWKQRGQHCRSDMFEPAAETWDNYKKFGHKLMNVTDEITI